MFGTYSVLLLSGAIAAEWYVLRKVVKATLALIDAPATKARHVVASQFRRERR